MGLLHGWTSRLYQTAFIAAGVAFAKYRALVPAIGDVVLFSVGRYLFTTAQAVGSTAIAALTWRSHTSRA